MPVPASTKAALLLAACVLAASVVSAGKPREDPSYEPDLAKAPGARVEDGVLVLTTKGLTARLAPVEGRARLEFLRARAGMDVDPFEPSPGRPRGFLTWVLVLENTGDAPVLFQPARATLETDSKDFRSPLDTAAVQSAYEMLDRPMPEAYAALPKVLFEGERTIPPKQSAAGLLAYQVPDPGTHGFAIALAVTNVRGDAIAVTAPFRRTKRK